MKALSRVIIKADNPKTHIDMGDVKFQIIPQWREYEEDVVVQSGTIIEVPKDSSNLKKGDYVYCHHFLTHHENDITNHMEGCYVMEHKNIYCRIVDGEVEMMDGWNLLEPVEEDKMNGEIVINTSTKMQTGLGIMRFPSKNMSRLSIVNGVFVEFKRNAGYLILVEGKKYYRLHDSNIIAYVGE